jgi:hypothetical protein
MKISIELSDDQANRLRAGAKHLGIEPEQLALAAVMDLIAAEGLDFESAASRVLEKNRELHPSLTAENRMITRGKTRWDQRSSRRQLFPTQPMLDKSREVGVERRERRASGDRDRSKVCVIDRVSQRPG